MPYSFQPKIDFQADGESNKKNVSITSDSKAGSSPTLAPAKVGQLTTRTDNTTGTLTMNAGHGITTGAKIGLFWSGGSRYVTVGTVATNSVPFSVGAGDNLPTNLTAVTAMVLNVETVSITGDNVVGVVVSSPTAVNAWVIFTDASDVVLLAYQLGGSNAYNADGYYAGSGATNPLATVTAAKVKMAHGDSTQSQTVKSSVYYN